MALADSLFITLRVTEPKLHAQLAANVPSTSAYGLLRNSALVSVSTLFISLRETNKEMS
jgi:hypothetical protein